MLRLSFSCIGYRLLILYFYNDLYKQCENIIVKIISSRKYTAQATKNKLKI